MSRSANLALRSLQLNSTSFCVCDSKSNRQERKRGRKKQRIKFKLKLTLFINFISLCALSEHPEKTVVVNLIYV